MRKLILASLLLLAGCLEPLPSLPDGMHYVWRHSFQSKPLILRRDEMTDAEAYLAGLTRLPDKVHCVRYRGGEPFLIHEDDMTLGEIQAVRWHAARKVESCK